MGHARSKSRHLFVCVCVLSDAADLQIVVEEGQGHHREAPLIDVNCIGYAEEHAMYLLYCKQS